MSSALNSKRRKLNETSRQGGTQDRSHQCSEPRVQGLSGAHTRLHTGPCAREPVPESLPEPESEPAPEPESEDLLDGDDQDPVPTQKQDLLDAQLESKCPFFCKL